ncbi:polyphosphate polymerase domain-containing protein [Demequina sp. NBRC 110056]|uniref:polyphosphate polymerase domain-containing protein n=1 Tax=Demequina sp. NBRC 110056 TaxID=1570345 RepID=UPI0009FFCAC9|nr:polyphosphate polymerase domain-containing protein [Demequina sp. NBRC 110056]
MTGSRIGWPEATSRLEPVDLAELDAAAALQTRTDRKYLVSPADWAVALGSLDPAPRVLEIDGLRTFRYESVYYDTPELTSYRSAAHRRPARFKVRTRHYIETGTHAIEVKLRSRTGETVKHREWLEPARVQGSAGPFLPAAARTFVAGFGETAGAVGALRETLTTSYARTTLLTADARVTVDSHVTGRAASGEAVDFGSALIVETKSASRAGAVDRALWALGIRPSRVSKYCTSLAALRPELPANRWARTLRRHVTVPQPA